MDFEGTICMCTKGANMIQDHTGVGGWNPAPASGQKNHPSPTGAVILVSAATFSTFNAAKAAQHPGEGPYSPTRPSYPPASTFSLRGACELLGPPYAIALDIYSSLRRWLRWGGDGWRWQVGWCRWGGRGEIGAWGGRRAACGCLKGRGEWSIYWPFTPHSTGWSTVGNFLFIFLQ